MASWNNTVLTGDHPKVTIHVISAVNTPKLQYGAFIEYRHTDGLLNDTPGQFRLLNVFQSEAAEIPLTHNFAFVKAQCTTEPASHVN